ncbi:MAG: class I SAM-dependent methyltransferase [Planctomycetota bacterium]|jgi:SAM-dependent methyltransferase
MSENNSIENGRRDNINPCGYCQATKSLRLYPTQSIFGDNFHINRCLNCNAVFPAPRPTPKQLETAYDDSYYGQGQQKFTAYIETVLDWFRQGRARRVNRYVKPPAKVLDIGCGNGKFLGNLIERGFEGYGIELSGRAAERAKLIPKLNLTIGQFGPDTFEENFFDVITMWHVFEHTEEPRKTLDIICKILKSGGYLMMSLPNIDSLQSRIFGGKWLHLDPPRHLFFIGASDLISKMKDFGFVLVRQQHLSLEQNPFGFQQSLLNCVLSKRDVLFESLKNNDTYTKEYSGFGIFLQKLFYIVTFPLFVLLAVIEASLKKGGTIEMVFKKQNS